ncbi:MAG TPA: UDP-N-acetylmuramyl-tripeptide synthetase, partial [Dehalococcoidia bacterium]|nr:UDP-N-acetylmuramyl-tripeptide synthetase [Dehalococcoidia bacterium]
MTPGAAFAALPGRNADGHDFLAAAVEAGAAAAVVQADREAKWRPIAERLPLVVVPDVRASLGRLAAAVHGEPSRRLRMIGVTGTDGKTTSTQLVAHVLDACGLGCGFLSSAGFDTGRGVEGNATHMTTLEATSIQELLAAAASSGRLTMVVEASSEGLAQHRLEGCEFDMAVFTNLTRDHLDFHGTMENYLAAKGILFEMLDRSTYKAFPRAAVLNADDPASEYLRGRSRAPAITYGLRESADFRARDVRPDGHGIRFSIRAADATFDAYLPLIGAFNAYNALAALAVASVQGVALEAATESLASFPGVPGRLERLECGQPFAVFVDIASTPAAFENVLLALRP